MIGYNGEDGDWQTADYIVMPRRSSFVLNQTLEKLRAGRGGAIAVCAGYKIGSDQYQAANVVLKALDGLAGTLTGNSEALWEDLHKT